MKDSAYKQAGVDVEAGAQLVDRIKSKANATDRRGVMGGLGGFGALFDVKAAGFEDPVLVAATDGVGTKLKVAIETAIHDTVGIDLVAMCVNDLIVQGAEPLFFLDYFASAKLDVDAAESVIAGIAEGCKRAGCALIGGETAEMPGMYAAGDYDLAGFSVGAVERNNIIDGSRIAAGDVLIGLSSDGVHSNGFSLVRRVVDQNETLRYDMLAPFDPEKTLGQALLTPTKIYVQALLKAFKRQGEDGRSLVKGLAHITGGGLTENIPRILPSGCGAILDAEKWAFSPVFQWLMKAGGLSPADMAGTFNCGIGMVVVCAAEQAEDLLSLLKAEGETAQLIGVVSESSESDSAVQIDNMEAQWLKQS